MNNLKTFKNFNNIDIFEFIDKYNIQAIKDYINSGYDLNVQDKYGNNPLHCFIIYNDVIKIQNSIN